MKFRYLLLLLLLIPFIALIRKPSSPSGWIKADIFLNPPVDYRSAPFYSLNDLLDTNEIIRQIQGFKDAGFGGFFLHSRGGLLTGYMGKEWWQAMDASVRAARQTGLKAWFYDEDKWPSGFAGGKIPLINDDFHARCLSRIDKNDPSGRKQNVIYEDDRYLYIIHKARMGNSWFNGTCYTDLLNPDMVKAFIDSAYAPYLDRYDRDLGKTVPGIFTDEPQISPRVSSGREGSVSFSPLIVERFMQMHGHDLLPNIPLLFDTTGQFKKVRYDYYQTLSRSFEESYSKQIGKFCAGNQAIFTGHFNGEESFNSIMVNSGNSMVNYRHMQIPGIDHLGLRYIPLNVPKSVSSVANQYGMIRRLSESYGISGHNMNFEDRKWLLDWLTLNGVNFIVPHLTSYSMKGERKRDYPPNFSPAQPYWKYNRLFEDYSARMCYVNTIGRYAADIALLHPLESEYLGIRNDCYQQYDRCLNELQKNHRNFDLVDEQILADTGKIENSELVVGLMKYKLVVLPAMQVVRSSTLNLLKEFSRSGGKILVYGRYPEYVDGNPDLASIGKLKEISYLTSNESFIKVLNEACPEIYSVKGTDNDLIWTSNHRVEGGGVIQLSNTSRIKEVDCRLSFDSKVRKIALWNPENGHSMKLVHDTAGNIVLHFSATQSWLISYGEASKEADFSQAYKIPKVPEEIAQLTGSWEGYRLDPNALTLDFARYSTDGGISFSHPEPVIGIHQNLARNKFSGKLLLKFEVSVSDVPLKCSLVTEQPELYRFSVNGKEIRFTGQDTYRDHAFRVQDISGCLKHGANEILLSVDYVAPQPSSFRAVERYGTEIESIYLIGDFAVNILPGVHVFDGSLKYRAKSLVEKPVYSAKGFFISKENTFFTGDLVLQGYPFYAGSFALKSKFRIDQLSGQKNYFLQLKSFEAIAVNVKVNGKEFAPLIYSPWRVDITSALKEGDNNIELILTNSLRNLLGPHHHSGGELIEVGPASFTGSQSWPNVGGESNWNELRKNGKASLWRDEYCLVSFGLLEPVVILGSAK